MSDAALIVSGLCVDRGPNRVIHDVDLQVRPGEVVALLGPNGAGKSTLLAALAGILPARAGTVATPGRIATVLQSPALARRTALANVELALGWWGVPRAQRRKRATAALDLMQAGPLAGRRARALSGGQQRRIHLARAVAISPEVLLLDEPFDGLDPQTHETLRDDTARALRASGGGVVVVLHDRRDAWAMADRIVVLIDGRVQADGRPQDVLSTPPTAEVARFLGYDGELRGDDGIVLTRAVHVRLDPDGELDAVVTDRVPVEDGVRLHLRTDRGEVWARHDDLDVAVGDQVRITVRGGVPFPRSGSDTAQER